MRSTLNKFKLVGFFVEANELSESRLNIFILYIYIYTLRESVKQNKKLFWGLSSIKFAFRKDQYSGLE